MVNAHVYRHGPADAPAVLALHGLTGHGRRWAHLAEQHLPDLRILAPDLRGHGRAPWTPPWNFEHIVDDLVALLDEEATGPIVVMGHSFGGAVALHLAHRHPERVRSLLLLDPAIALPAEPVLQAATDAVAFPDYADVAEARMQKQHEAWGELAPELLEAEIAEHLIPLSDERVGWRISVPAIGAYYGELARDLVLPDVPTILVQAMKVQPAYVRPEVRAALAGHLGGKFRAVELDCDHMVSMARPVEVAGLLRELL
ncbi:alpha/beta hydrolase [Skermania sp. ID1734]|uniref:alpha/beta fold hydrolase n=1 Tax=Skermania sp. ID1734 TaxID=2597516 RepID=UPI00117F9F1C|nr:alpha/beta fold hydrolase [Skermania sp. ID1734]TSD97296.1 alpha/beta hydrolase [Skermania sp. ID1734]